MIPLGIIMLGDGFINAITTNEEDPQYQQNIDYAAVGLATLILGFFMFVIGLVLALILRRR